MDHPIDHSDTPIRLFTADWMESFTHVSPLTVLAFWLPFAGWLLASSFSEKTGQGFPSQLLIGVVGGMFLWTLVEYLLHRFVFHFQPHGPVQERIIYLFHGIHHHQPQCKTRLVMPPAVSIPLSLIFVGLFYAIFGLLLGQPQWVKPLIAGFTIGYLCYDMLHYATHHLPMRWGLFKVLKRYHMKHHYKAPDHYYGVSSPLWDVVFGTLPKE